MRYRAVAAWCAAVILVVVGVGVAVTASASWTRAEYGVLLALNDAHTPPFTAFALGINLVFGTRVAPFVALLCALAVGLAARRPSAGIEFALLVGIGWGGNQLIKTLVHRSRPPLTTHGLLVETGYSFPSGHTAFAACLGLAFVVLCWRTRGRVWAIAGATVIATLTTLSRMYLGVHYPTDVAASLVYSTAAVILLAATWERFVRPRLRRWTPRPSR